MESKNDKELMQLVCKKNREAFKMLYQRYEIRIFNFVLHHAGSRGIAQELIQETFTRVWFAAHTFDQKRGNFKAWIFTIALNLTRTEMRKKEYSYHFLDIKDIKGSPDQHHLVETQSPDLIMEKDQQECAIIQALGYLKPEQREVIILKNFQQLKFREISEVTELSESTIKARYHRAIEQLKKTLICMEGENHV
jgi:RNA polymerase sigma factor (sigma-70 family)